MPRVPEFVPDGNLIGIPWRVALALQADGWVLRQDIIWYSPNKMPESVTNRCTKSHEHIFMLVKGSGYYFDALAIAETAKHGPLPRLRVNGQGVDETKALAGKQQAGNGELVNKRDVWIVPTHGYSGAHFASYSPRLIEPCITAGTSEHGACAACGMPWERVAVRVGGSTEESGGKYDTTLNNRNGIGSSTQRAAANRYTVGWRRPCGCLTDEVVPCTVLDPFVGSGTTVATALSLGRRGIGIDLSETYLKDCAIPRIETAASGGASRRPTVPVRGAAPPAPRRMRG